jgi:hypothetical protein
MGCHLIARKRVDTMEKMTNLKAVAYVLENCTLPADVAEKMEKIKASFEKKSTGERKPTATQVANEGLKGSILSYMAENPDRVFSISELIKEVPELEGLSTQKVSPMISALVKEFKVVRIEEKRKAYFKIA